MSSLYLSVIIPAFNEEENLKKGVLDEVYSYLKKQKYSWEIIVVNDGSKDKTASLMQRFIGARGFRLIQTQHQGKGRAIMEGIKNSKGRIVLFTDMDQSTPLNQVEKFLPEFENGYDIVIGLREKRPGEPFVRKLTSSGFIFLRKLFLSLPYTDTQCGFKVFKREAIERILGSLCHSRPVSQHGVNSGGDPIDRKRWCANWIPLFRGMTKRRRANVLIGPSYGVDFDLEVLYLAKTLNLKVTEVPVKWEYKENPGFNPIIHSWQALKSLLKIKLNILQGKYK